MPPNLHINNLFVFNVLYSSTAQADMIMFNAYLQFDHFTTDRQVIVRDGEIKKVS